MNSYLNIAVEILRSAKRPMSPRAIMLEALKFGLIPSNLYGKTQHKTLHARISEDIIKNREFSLFFRTEPGKFFLSEYITDTTIPDDFRRPFPTRRRIRELVRGPALAISRKALSGHVRQDTRIEPKKIYELFYDNQHSYKNPQEISEDHVFVRSFVCVRRTDEVLSYRLGRYRDDRDGFMAKRSIGFASYVQEKEQTLFNMKDYGIVDSGVNAAKIDLDIAAISHNSLDSSLEATLTHFIWSSQTGKVGDLLAIVSFRCPTWFEPITRRLALTDLSWLNMKYSVNNIDDFDLWSKNVLLAHYRAGANLEAGFGSEPETAGQSSD